MRADFLNFESPNKADYIIVESAWGIPYSAQTYIRENMNSPESNDLLKFLRNAFNDQNLDKRNPKFKSGKTYFVRIRNRGTESYNFTDEQILHIGKYSKSKKLTEILKELFPQADFQAINAIVPWAKELQKSKGWSYTGEAEVYDEAEKIQDYGGDYVPPTALEEVAKKINKACPEAGWSINRNLWTAFQKRCLKFLRGNLGLLKFCLTINSFKTPKDKQLFETEFIRSCYDKPEMIPDDINHCMMLAEEYTRSMKVREIINLLDDKLRACLAGEDKMGDQKALAEQMKSKSSELEKINANIQKLTKSLNNTFESRKKISTEYSNSLGPFIALCCDEKKRDEINKAQRAYEKDILLKELEKIDEEQVHGEINVISIREILGFRHDIMD